MADDSVLSELLVINTKKYFSALEQAYSHKLQTFVFYMIRDWLSAEDIVQETLLSAYIALQRTSPEEIRSMQFGPWLIKIAFHRCLNHRRDNKNLSKSISIDLPEGQALVEGMDIGYHPSPEVEVEKKESQSELYAYVDQLPDPLRITIILRYKGDLSYVEIADLLNQSPNTVKSNGRRGLLKLRQMQVQKSRNNEERR